jgi:hypothetical protein
MRRQPRKTGHQRTANRHQRTAERRQRTAEKTAGPKKPHPKNPGTKNLR